MRLTIPLPRYSPERKTKLLTAGGLARAGKGTSMTAIEHSLQADGLSVVVIDQGRKYRALGVSAARSGVDLDSEAALTDFVRSDKARRDTRAILDEASVMDEAGLKELLYNSDASKASGRLGKLEVTHHLAGNMLRAEVEQAVQRQYYAALIDGRAMNGYAEQFHTEGLGSFVMDWYFKCDSGVAAVRSLGWANRNLEELSDAENVLLAKETTRIRERNHWDVTRTHEPSREPVDADRLDLLSYYDSDTVVPFGRGQVVRPMGSVVVDTTFTNGIERMTAPIVEVSRLALDSYDALLSEPAGLWVP